MLADLIKAKLESLNVKWKQNNKEIMCRCLNPAHNDNNPSFSINVENGAYNCFSCGYRGNFKKLLNLEIDEETERNMKYLQILRELEVNEKVVEGPIGYAEQLLPPNSNLSLPEEGIRGISLALLKTLGVYYCTVGKYRGRLIFPVKSIDNEILGFDARIYTLPGQSFIEPVNPHAKYLRPSFMKTKDIAYGVDYIYTKWQSVDTVIITEGIFDALSWLEMGIPAVANFGVSTPSITKMASLLALGVQNVMNGFDLDKAGIDAWQAVKEDWRQYFHIESPSEELKLFQRSGFKDVNDYLMNLKEERDWII